MPLSYSKCLFPCINPLPTVSFGVFVEIDALVLRSRERARLQPGSNANRPNYQVLVYHHCMLRVWFYHQLYFQQFVLLFLSGIGCHREEATAVHMGSLACRRTTERTSRISSHLSTDNENARCIVNEGRPLSCSAASNGCKLCAVMR
jgi:hypothetical protein